MSLKKLIEKIKDGHLSDGQYGDFDSRSAALRDDIVRLAKEEGYTNDDVYEAIGDAGEYADQHFEMIWDRSIDNSD